MEGGKTQSKTVKMKKARRWDSRSTPTTMRRMTPRTKKGLTLAIYAGVVLAPIVCGRSNICSGYTTTNLGDLPRSRWQW